MVRPPKVAVSKSGDACPSGRAVWCGANPTVRAAAGADGAAGGPRLIEASATPADGATASGGKPIVQRVAEFIKSGAAKLIGSRRHRWRFHSGRRGGVSNRPRRWRRDNSPVVAAVAGDDAGHGADRTAGRGADRPHPGRPPPRRRSPHPHRRRSGRRRPRVGPDRTDWCSSPAPSIMPAPAIAVAIDRVFTSAPSPQKRSGHHRSETGRHHPALQRRPASHLPVQ